MKALLLGNSPALVHPDIDLSLIPRGEIVVFGANRLWHRDKPEWQLILPDFLGMIDSHIEPEWLPPEGSIHGLLVLYGVEEKAARHGTVCSFLGRKDLIKRKRQGQDGTKVPPGDDFPKPGEPYLAVNSTPGFLACFILEFPAFDEIGILGIEYTAWNLYHDGLDSGEKLQTHWYGYNPGCGGSPRAWGLESPACTFWTRYRKHCEKIGVSLRNLSPYEDTPFDLAGIPRERYEDWIKG